jgi:hypothetical protein
MLRPSSCMSIQKIIGKMIFTTLEEYLPATMDNCALKNSLFHSYNLNLLNPNCTRIYNVFPTSAGLLANL